MYLGNLRVVPTQDSNTWDAGPFNLQLKCLSHSNKAWFWWNYSLTKRCNSAARNILAGAGSCEIIIGFAITLIFIWLHRLHGKWRRRNFKQSSPLQLNDLGGSNKNTYILIQHIIKMGQINPEGRRRWIYGP